MISKTGSVFLGTGYLGREERKLQWRGADKSSLLGGWEKQKEAGKDEDMRDARGRVASFLSLGLLGGFFRVAIKLSPSSAASNPIPITPHQLLQAGAGSEAVQ